MSTSGPGDEEQKPQWQQPEWKSGDPLDQGSGGQPDRQPPQQDQPSWQQPQQPSWQQPQEQSWQQSQPQWGGQQQQWGSAPQTPGSATAALILGICSLLICGPICGPLAIIYGNKAKREIAGSNGNLTGGGMATAGVIMGWIAVALTIIAVLIIIVAIAAGS
jgi:hypothetical protein